MHTQDPNDLQIIRVFGFRHIFSQSLLLFFKRKWSDDINFIAKTAKTVINANGPLILAADAKDGWP